MTEDALCHKISCHQVLGLLSTTIWIALYIIIIIIIIIIIFIIIIIIIQSIFDKTYIFNVVVKSVQNGLKYFARALIQ